MLITNLTHVLMCLFPFSTCFEQPSFHHQSDIYQMMYWYNWISWWWALGCSKHV